MTAGTPYGRGGDRPHAGDQVPFQSARTDWKVIEVGTYTDGPYWVSFQQMGTPFRKRYQIPASRLRLFKRAAS